MSIPKYTSGYDFIARFKKSRQWLWRIETTDPNFPKPIYIGGEKFYPDEGIQAWLEHPDRRIEPRRGKMPKKQGRKKKVAVSSEAAA